MKKSFIIILIMMILFLTGCQSKFTYESPQRDSLELLSEDIESMLKKARVDSDIETISVGNVLEITVDDYRFQLTWFGFKIFDKENEDGQSLYHEFSCTESEVETELACQYNKESKVDGEIVYPLASSQLYENISVMEYVRVISSLDAQPLLSILDLFPNQHDLHYLAIRYSAYETDKLISLSDTKYFYDQTTEEYTNQGDVLITKEHLFIDVIDNQNEIVCTIYLNLNE